MKILAIETSTSIASVAIISETNILGEYTVNNNKTHSQKLMPLIKSLVENVNLTINEIDVFAASIGPGSFTGLRIGVTTAKSLSFALKKPIIGINTLDALSNNIGVADKLICPMIDARNNQVFTSIYKNSKKIFEYSGITIKELSHVLKDLNYPTIFLGDGAILHREYFKKELLENFEIAPPNLVLPIASSTANLALAKAKLHEFDDYFNLSPFYLRKSQAERLACEKSAT